MNYFKIHLLYFFRYVILNIGDGLMKIRCEMCDKLELEKSAKFFIENFDINYADE